MHHRIFITGGAGFIGSNFIRYIRRSHRDASILNFDKLTYAGNLKNLEDVPAGGDYTFVKGDICDKDAVFQEFQRFAPDIVVNFAAESHVDRSIIDSSEFIRTNIFGVKIMLDAAMKYGAEKFIQISTDEV
ncbi:MAG TPA: GDP-mannose 4,6-dehydratase, partial [Methanomicrobiales archaeon]|nr:GDP-mannose 4,6-dehydratase [Methanomicrobiales archaeon]